MNVISKAIISTAILLSLASCSTISEKNVTYKSVAPTVFPVIHGIGYAPISLQKSDNETQRMLMAIKASKLAAYAELTEQVYGQQISNKLIMEDLLIENDQLKSSIQGIIRGAKVVRSYPVGDTYTTEVTVDFKDVYDLYLTQQRKNKIY